MVYFEAAFSGEERVNEPAVTTHKEKFEVGGPEFKIGPVGFTRAPSFLARALSFRSPRPKVNNSDDDERTSSATAPIMPSSVVDSARC
ncbi:hypothetical protein RYX36_032432 [Vicia faba]